MTAVRKLIKRFYSTYLSAKLVLMMDIVISFIASVFSLCLVLIVAGGRSPYGWDVAVAWLAIALVSSALFFIVFKCYRAVIRHMTMLDIGRYGFASLCKDLLLYLVFSVVLGFDSYILMLSLFDFLFTFTCLMSVRVLMVFVFEKFRVRAMEDSKRERVLIYGNRNKASSLVTRLASSEEYCVVGLISPYPDDDGTMIADKRVYSFRSWDNLKSFALSKGVNAILFAHANDLQHEQDGLVSYCIANSIRILLAPSVDEVLGGKVMRGRVREVKIEDLLGRTKIRINLEAIKANLAGKVVMVTGAAGSIGSELVRQLATSGVRQLVLFDNAETPLHNLRLEMEDRYPGLDFVPVIGDVRQELRLDYAFRRWRPQVVFHSAAYKHVPLMEENPCEAALVNVSGSRNVADKCIQYGVERMVMISTDNAVNPTNVMGCTKRLAEIYVQSLGLAIENGSYVMPKGAVVDKPVTKFVITRFGNVLGSNGSVFQRFREQIEMGGPVTVTHPDMVRFFMTIPDVCRLVLEAATLTDDNQTFVFDMGRPVKIDALARKMIKLAGLVPDKDIRIEYTGLRPGEKLYEEVLSNTENIMPTNHERIRIASVREYDYGTALAGVDELTRLAKIVDIPDMIRLMKSIVPEYKSMNSGFEKYDTPDAGGVPAAGGGAGPANDAGENLAHNAADSRKGNAGGGRSNWKSRSSTNTTGFDFLRRHETDYQQRLRVAVRLGS